jgi:hypothetical protein
MIDVNKLDLAILLNIWATLRFGYRVGKQMTV